jgi:hypothetical protein
MLCFYYKWKISQKADLGKDLSGFVRRHLQRCTSCRQYSRVSQALTEKLSKETPHALKEQKSRLRERIISALVEEMRPARVRKPVSRYFPVLVVSILILVVAIGLVSYLNNPSVPNGNVKSILPLSKMSVAGLSLKNILGGVESPMEKEMKSLKQSMKSTAEFLVSCLDFNLGKPIDRI